MASIRPEQIQDIINASVKFRETFHPFCLSILYEKQDEHLENGRKEGFMITFFTCHKENPFAVTAVVHVDKKVR